jgi:cell shape-determining protein MreC
VNYVIHCKILKELLGRTVFTNTILGAVLVRPNVSLYDTFVIDIGAREGISVGDLIVVSGDTIMGTISEVYNTTSKVKLFSTPGEITRVTIGASAISADAEGRGGGNFQAKLPRDVDVEEGDSVIMPGITQKLFGVVEKVVSNPTDPFKTILFKNPINSAEIEWVQVITK